MLNVTLLTVGKIKEKYLNDGITEYAKRLSRYCSLEIVEVADEKTPDGASAAIEEQIKAKEAERLFKYIKDDAFVIALAINGKMYDSVGFSKEIENIAVSGKSRLVFVIGGSLGLHDTIIKRADSLLSFSKMTFPHQLMRMIFLEQLYRAFKISSNEPYHK